MPRARSRSSASVSLAFRCAAATSMRVRAPSSTPSSARAAPSPHRRPAPRSAGVGGHVGGRVEAFLDLAERHGERGEPDLGAVVQVTLDPPQPGGRLVDHAGAPVPAVRGRVPRPARSAPARPARLPAGRRAPRARRSRRAGSGRPPESPSTHAVSAAPPSPTAAANSGAPGMRRVRRGPADDRRGGAEQADHQAGDGDPPRPVGGERCTAAPGSPRRPRWAGGWNSPEGRHRG